MYVDYSTNNIILLISTIPKINIDIDSILQKEKKGKKYRGSINISRSSYSIKITKNGFIYIFLKNLFNIILTEIEKFVHDICCDILEPSSHGLNQIRIDVVNIQISISLFIENKSIKFIQLFEQLYNNLKDIYKFKIKESNTFESIWLTYDEIKHRDIIFLSTFRIVDDKITLTISHNLKGSCITKDISLFLLLCSEIKKAISQI